LFSSRIAALGLDKYDRAACRKKLFKCEIRIIHNR
jgi:hypothetical protein